MAKKQNKTSSAILSALDRPVLNFPLLIPFLYAVILLLILVCAAAIYIITSQDQYDKAKYQRFSQTLLRNEQQSIQALGLPAPLLATHDGLPCRYQGPGPAIITTGDRCSLEVHVLEPSSGVLTDTTALNALVIAHGWTGDDLNTSIITRGGLTPNGANLQYSRPYRPGGTLNLTILEYVGSYRLTVSPNISSDAIQNWHG
jgi:hypothetical protein